MEPSHLPAEGATAFREYYRYYLDSTDDGNGKVYSQYLSQLVNNDTDDHAPRRPPDASNDELVAKRNEECINWQMQMKEIDAHFMNTNIVHPPITSIEHVLQMRLVRPKLSKLINQSAKVKFSTNSVDSTSSGDSTKSEESANSEDSANSDGSSNSEESSMSEDSSNSEDLAHFFYASVPSKKSTKAMCRYYPSKLNAWNGFDGDMIGSRFCEKGKSHFHKSNFSIEIVSMRLPWMY